MFATAATLALLALVGWLVTETFRANGAKILAALQGHSWTSNIPAAPAPVSVRVTQRYPSARPVRSRPEWRAAA